MASQLQSWMLRDVECCHTTSLPNYATSVTNAKLAADIRRMRLSVMVGCAAAADGIPADVSPCWLSFALHVRSIVLKRV